jgi:TldD protein
MSSGELCGVGIRVLVNGTWGFASTAQLDEESLLNALQQAEALAKSLAPLKKEKVQLATPKELAKGDFVVEGYMELSQIPIKEKLDYIQKTELTLRKNHSSIEAASCGYAEIFEEKIVITNDGADVWSRLVRPEIRFSAVASDGTKRTNGFDSIGVTGTWDCLFKNRSTEEILFNTAGSAVDLLKAPEGKGGQKEVILSPSMVGLLSHEAIGHTVEADFVKAGSVAENKIGETVASELVTLCDSGLSDYKDFAGGSLPVDDEGVFTEKTRIIEKGKLVSYLHNRESAAEFGVVPTGNARSWEFADEPLIRMRNTYIEPGGDNLEDMISSIDDGYFVDGAGGGQADATGEFMFGASRVRKISKGKVSELVQPLSISGIAFDVLKSVDGVSKDFKWDLGAGYCGKGQPAKVDAGGPYIKCKVLVGGAQ